MQVKLSSLSVWQKIQLLRRQLNVVCLERKYQIDALIALMISKQHGLLLGPPGTGKSMLIQMLCEAFSGNYFSMLISESSKLEQFFGPISIKGLQKDESYVRNFSKMLPEANIAYLDEIFKTGAGALNELLQIINERTYKHGTDIINVPLRTVIGSSNELPEEGSGAAAFVDRFAWKSWVGYLQDDDNVDLLWDRTIDNCYPKISVKFQLSDLDTAKQQAENSIEIKSQKSILKLLRRKLSEGGYTISDRRWQMILKFMQVFAWVRNESTVSLETIKLLLPDCMWQQPDEQKDIVVKINDVLNGLTARLEEIKSQAKSTTASFKNQERYNHSMNDWHIVGTELAIETLATLNVLVEELRNLQKTGASNTICEAIIHSINQDTQDMQNIIQRLSEEDNSSKKEELARKIDAAIKEGQKLTDAMLNEKNSSEQWTKAVINLCKMLATSAKKLNTFDTGNGTSDIVALAKKDLSRMIVDLKEAIATVNCLD